MVEDLDKDVDELVKSIVTIVNEYREDFSDLLNLYKDRTLGFVILDSKYNTAFMIKAGRMRALPSQDIKDTTATIYTYKKTFLDFLNADDMRAAGVMAYHTYNVRVESSDGLEYVHYKNLLDIIERFQKVVGG